MHQNKVAPVAQRPMATVPHTSLKTNRGHSRWRWIGIILLILFVAGAIGARLLISHAEPILRGRIIETLSTRFKGQVELQRLDVSVLQGLQVSGRGLKIFTSFDPIRAPAAYSR